MKVFKPHPGQIFLWKVNDILFIYLVYEAFPTQAGPGIDTVHKYVP